MQIRNITENKVIIPHCKLCGKLIFEARAVSIVVGYSDFGTSLYFYYHIKCVKEVVKDAV